MGDSSDTNTSDADNSDTNTSDTDENEDSQATTSAGSEDDTSSDDESSENKTQQKPSEFESTANYIHPLDVPEKDNVLGKTVIVAGKAVVLMDNHKGQVYGIPEGTEADVVEEASTEAETQTEPDKTEHSISVSYERSGEDSIAQRKFYKQKDLTEIQFEAVSYTHLRAHET